MNAKDYTKIAGWFAQAFGAIQPPIAFANAILIMRRKPELCLRLSAWDEMMWLIVEEFLNSDGNLENEDCFLQACALLEA